MDVVREEQAAFREEMDSVKSKIEQIFEAIQALARREEEARVAAAARNDALVQGVALQSGPSVPIPNPVIYGLPPGFVPPPERTHVPPPAHTSGVDDGVAAQGPPIVNQVVIPRTDEELQDEFEMQNYNGATSVVIPTAAQDSELKCRNIHTWDELAEAFVKQYKYNTDMAPNRTQLQSMAQKDSESFKEYAQRWRELAARVHPPLVDRELIDIFMGTLQGQYYERLISSVSIRFSDMVIVGERVEEGLKSGKIQGGSSSQPILKKPFNRFKRKEGETSAISSQRGRVPYKAPASVPYYQYPYVEAAQYPTMPYHPNALVPIPAPVPQYQAPQPQFQAPPPQHQQRIQQNNQPRPVQQQRPNQQRPYQQYNNMNTTPIPMTYTQLLPYLIQNETVVPRALPPMPKPHKPWYDENVRCAFHANSEGHTTENCKVFKLRVQELIDKKILSFADVPNVGNNPLPKHDGSGVNAIESSTDD
ncbi:chromatin-remodeling ATPase INO80-like [Lathyrus oleraceus]|uniref:chromatin-remodeling ATPase INO80-like n=1 Tax=Pisum sativum TaxID=3888 RepID=UPI0021D3A6EE|nr:chromatin-remodeling ATPase INO80-like [Pisum sativum]